MAGAAKAGKAAEQLQHNLRAHHSIVEQPDTSLSATCGNQPCCWQASNVCNYQQRSAPATALSTRSSSGLLGCLKLRTRAARSARAAGQEGKSSSSKAG